MPFGKFNRAVWAMAIVLLAILAARTYQNTESYFGTVGRLDVSDAAGVIRIKWTGKIEAPMAARLAEVAVQHQHDDLPFRLTLASPGGTLSHGAKVVELLREIASKRPLDTVVESGAMCASMCVPVYLQGQRRFAAPDARFMFHEVSYREFMAQEKSNVPQSSTDAATAHLFATYFAPAAVPEGWISNMRAQVKGGNDVWKTARQLVDERAGIVQQITD